MDIIRLAENAMVRIKEMVDIPNKGIIAGGALANLIWEEVSGNPAIINDIDIFNFVRLMSVEEMEEERDKVTYSKNFYNKKDIEFLETYNGLTIRSKTADFFKIIEVKRDGLLNTIEICGPNKDPNVIIDSFDINCTQIAYCIEENKFYWADEFVDFLKTSELKISNLMSPTHTAIRIVKKSHELNAKLDHIELKMCQYSVLNHFYDTNRKYFTEKYFLLFRKYESILGEYFKFDIDKDISNKIELKSGDKVRIFFLRPNTDNMNVVKNDDFDIFSVSESESYLIEEFRNLNVFDGNQLIKYVRHFQHIDQELFSTLKYIVGDCNYFNYNINDKELKLLKSLIDYAPKSIGKLNGLTLKEQVVYINKLMDRYPDKDRNILLCVLEHQNFELSKVCQYTNDDYLLFELTQRVEISKKSMVKKNRIFGDTLSDVESVFDEIGF
jgi:hypothetical protein